MEVYVDSTVEWVMEPPTKIGQAGLVPSNTAKKVKIAAWRKEDNFAVIREIKPKGDTHQQIIFNAEKEAVFLGLSLSPTSVFCDNLQVVSSCSDIVCWVSRKENKVADYLSKQDPGEGKVYFKSLTPSRDWITFIPYKDLVELMPSNPDSGFHFRSFLLAKFYDLNYSREGRYLAAKQDLERYRFILNQALFNVGLSSNDAIAIWHAINGCDTSHTDELNILKLSVIDALEDSPVPIKKYELAQKITNMSMAEWMAVVDACDRVGSGQYSINNLAEELKRVNLI